jgi:BRCT domain type II-containing protein
MIIIILKRLHQSSASIRGVPAEASATYASSPSSPSTRTCLIPARTRAGASRSQTASHRRSVFPTKASGNATRRAYQREEKKNVFV